jgi:hypothetical protein
MVSKVSPPIPVWLDGEPRTVERQVPLVVAQNAEVTLLSRSTNLPIFPQVIENQ